MDQKLNTMANIPYKEFISLSATQKTKCLLIIQTIIAAIKAKHS
jgi:hypothetical protein